MHGPDSVEYKCKYAYTCLPFGNVWGGRTRGGRKQSKLNNKKSSFPPSLHHNLLLQSGKEKMVERTHSCRVIYHLKFLSSSTQTWNILPHEVRRYHTDKTAFSSTYDLEPREQRRKSFIRAEKRHVMQKKNLQKRRRKRQQIKTCRYI